MGRTHGELEVAARVCKEPRGVLAMLGAARCYGGALAVRRLVDVVVDAGGFVLCPQRGVRGGRAVDSCEEAMRVRARAMNERRVGE